MALTIYNPKTRAFASQDAPSADLPLNEMLLLNILIELQTITQILSENSSDDPADIRTDIVSNL